LSSLSIDRLGLCRSTGVTLWTNLNNDTERVRVAVTVSARRMQL